MPNINTYGAPNKVRRNNTTDPCAARAESNPAIPHNRRKKFTRVDVNDAETASDAGFTKKCQVEANRRVYWVNQLANNAANSGQDHEHGQWQSTTDPK